jgi:hypothetical protein
MRKPVKPAKPAKPAHESPGGWLMVTVGDDETALPPGKAGRLVASLVGDTGEALPTVAEVRAAYPHSVYVGTAHHGQVVTLRSLVGPDDDDEFDDYDE